ncbi:hypothetical protein EII29_10515 [Leptotrichia sp. OH3620_COT-345]|uniref:hypothetical protein n=1 Tax=Leptotrichia sp. OH3620_COT-345 TaxID=2491048 RepID=UPI000F649814|nr:hypothetical protein [Leptotrichia sp. OH3620_COT-345]RRD38256.1 hypothetical protein EII29_10515 [Leptotrichia sp. OH3620_COT-345]
MSSYYEQHKRRKKISKGVKSVMLLFVFSIFLTAGAILFMQGNNPELKKEVEKLKTEKENKEKELKIVQENLETKEKSYNELKNKLDKN